jgi:hypothetical protein
MRASRTRTSIHAAALATALTAVTGCSAAGSGTTAAPAGTLPTAHVHGVAIDPGDGALLLATHEGLLEVGADGELTQAGPVIDLMGFTIAGPDRYLASGHPGLQVVDLPNPVGLIESTDGGATWTPLSRGGESDFHTLTASPAGTILGFDGVLRRSADGRAWEQLAVPAEPHTLAAAPGGATVLATTAAGLLRSADAGDTWDPVDGAPPLQVVAWVDDTTAVGVDPAGTVWTSTDTAGTWQENAQLGAVPHAVTAAPASGGGPGRIAVVTDAGLLESDDGGRTFTVVLER